MITAKKNQASPPLLENNPLPNVTPVKYNRSRGGQVGVPWSTEQMYPDLQYPEANADLVRAYCDIIADSIMYEPASFDQGKWGLDEDHTVLVVDCGTPGCVAGHLLAYLGMRDETDVQRVASREWGLTLDQSDCLFSYQWPKQWFMDLPQDAPLPLAKVPTMRRWDGSVILDGHRPSPEHAAAILQRLAQYGWDGATYAEAFQNRGY